MEDSHLDKIKRFLSGNMQESERMQFEQELEENEELQKEVSAYIMAVEVVEQDVRFDLKEQMTTWETPKMDRTISPRTITIIILLLFAIGIASVIWVCPSKKEQNFEQFAVVTLEGVQRSEETEEKVKLLNQSYLNGQYQEAEQLLQSMSPGLRNTAEVEFIDALLAYRNEKFSEAAESFALLEENEAASFIVQDQSEYFYLLALIRMEACYEACKKELINMAQDANHLRQAEASRLVEYMGFEE